VTSLHYVVVPSLHEAPLSIAGRLRIPEVDGKLPAVILLHGSTGPSEREGGYADPLNAAGFVTLELDQWSPRGLAGGAAGRPRTVQETLPDLYGARAWLAAHPLVDATRIGVIGFSFGAVAAMLAATRAQNDPFLGDGHFAALMPVYPICHLYNRAPGFEFGDLVDAPVLIVTGALDGYDNDPEAGPALVAALAPADRARVRAEVMADAHHGFDMPGEARQVQDPAGNRGQGGLLTMAYNPQAASRSHALAVAFFTDAMGSENA
jgi:dienelactone hydrolase